MNEAALVRRLASSGRRFLLKSVAVDLSSSGERAALVWSWFYIFALFLAYYILRPIREELGVSGGVRNLPWLFSGTLAAMAVANPLFAWVIRRWPREKFISITYRFFMVNLLIFMLLLALASPEERVWTGRAFFIWVSVFNLFVISVFWSFVVDIFTASQARRLFGFLATGATAGGIVGSAMTSGLVDIVGQGGLLFISMVLLELAVYAARRLSALSYDFNKRVEREEAKRPIGGGLLSGITNTFSSPYLLGIAGFILFYSLTSTILYFNQASIAEQQFSDKASRTAFFANINLWVNGLTLIVQVFLTGRIIAWAGLALTLCALPLMSVAGFSLLSIYPGIVVFVIFQVSRNVSNYALTRPAREILFTAVSREDRFKTKNFIDTVVYRAGDQLAAWSCAGLFAAGLSMGGIALFAVPLSAVWLALSFWLGAAQQRWERRCQ